MASMVVIFFPATAATGVTHERIGCPSSCTVQAPQSAIPQPNLVPVRPTTSRSTHKTGMSAGTSTVTSRPLMFRVAMTDSPCEDEWGVPRNSTSPALREKAHQLRVHLCGMCPQHTVRPILQLDELDVLDHFRLATGARIGRQNPICIAVQDERRHIVARDVLAEVLDPRIDARQRAGGGCARGHVPVVFDDALAHELSAQNVIVVKVVQEVEQERGSVGLDP